jgi:hypothetical protein
MAALPQLQPDGSTHRRRAWRQDAGVMAIDAVAKA